MNVLGFLENLPRPAAVAMGVALTVVVGVLDVLTGYELAFSTFYLVPIFILTWSGRLPGGLVGAVGSTVFRTWADLTGRSYTHALSLYWNIGMRLALFVIVAAILASLRRLFEEQRVLASVDHVTGAANRRTFLDALVRERERARRYGSRYALAYIDLDNFKSVNDTRGHAAGDAVLRLVTGTLQANVRTIDTVGRLGGDEFGLLLPETDEAQAVSAVAKLRDRLLERLAREEGGVTFSVGIFAVTDPRMEVEAVMQAADAQMYAAKLAGKNRVRSASGQPAPVST